MVNLLKKLQLILVVLFVASCASGSKEVKQELRAQVQTARYEEALSTLENSEYFKDNPQSKLLYLMEKGVIFHGMGQFNESIKAFEEAKALAQKQYTVRISKKISTYIGNDSSDIYYGEKYELSMLYFYQALNHYSLSFSLKKDQMVMKEGKPELTWVDLNDKERRKSLFRARAELLAWDSFLKELKTERSGSSVFKTDLAAKILGGFIHESIGTRDDREIAYQLYKDSLKMLIKNYGAYKSFNKNFETYVKDYKKFPSLGMNKVRSEYIKETRNQKELKKFLETKVLTLAKKVRRRSWKKEIRPFKINLKKIKAKKKSNVTLVLQEGIIPNKFGEKQYFGLGKELRKSPAGAIMAIFAADILGLYPPPGSYNPAGAHLGYNVAKLAISEAAVQFELPKIEESRLNYSVVLEIWKDGKLYKEKKVPVVNPLGDIAEQAIIEQAAWLYPKVGARLATKHAVAIIAAYGTYQGLKGDDGKHSFLAKNAAILQYLASSKGIEASEAADVRQWSTIPKALRMMDFYLSPGTYDFKLRASGEIPKEHQLGQVIVKSKKKNLLIQKRVNF
jgi:tetratricopeptide (TPR) repeat protein